MKKTLLSIFSVLLVSVMAIGQNFTTQYGDTSTAPSPGPGEFFVYNKITNTSSAATTYNWRYVDSDYPSGWAYAGVCDNKTCYGNDLLNGNAVTSLQVNAGSDMDYHAVFNDMGAANGSVAWIQTKIWETGSLSSKTLTFVATKGVTSAVTVTRFDDDIVLYPNPARNSLNIIYDADLGVKNIGVYNLIGKMVNIYKVGSNSAKLDVDNLPSGIYFVRLFNAQGTVVGTRKFTHQ